MEKINLSEKISKESYRNTIPELEKELGRLQRQAKELAIPLLIVFEGWDAAGKGTIMNRLLLAMDARGFVVHVTRAPNEEERFRPFLWRFWTRTPAPAQATIMCG